jgi:hypothetical protein
MPVPTWPAEPAGSAGLLRASLPTTCTAAMPLPLGGACAVPGWSRSPRWWAHAALGEATGIEVVVIRRIAPPAPSRGMARSCRRCLQNPGSRRTTRKREVATDRRRALSVSITTCRRPGALPTLLRSRGAIDVALHQCMRWATRCATPAHGQPEPRAHGASPIWDGGRQRVRLAGARRSGEMDDGSDRAGLMD